MSAHVPTRRREEPPPLQQALFALVAAAVITGGACLLATAAAPAANRGLIAVLTGMAALILCAAVTAGTYGFQTARQLRTRVAATDAELARLADKTLPALVKLLRDGASADTALAEITRPAGRAQQRILHTLAEEIGKGERMRAAAMAASANAVGRVQALATSMLADLREMEDRHDEEVLGDLLRLDHSTAQVGRLADSVAVLTGARSGRRWTKPIMMESILRGAVGRISAYQRVRVHSTSLVAIAGYAAEGVMHALAELMDNATRFSPPSEKAHVYVEEVHAGIVVTIEDAGLTMSATALRRAERAVSSEPLDLMTLSGTRLGLAVVGCLARKHGLTVSFRPSSRGGTGVVVMIPRKLITQAAPDAAPAMSRAVRPSTPAAAAEPRPTVSVGAAAAPTETGPTLQAASPAESGVPVAEGKAPGLPKRPKGQTLAAASPPPAEPISRPAKSAAEAAERFRAFRQSGRGGPASGAKSSPPADDT
ncbi:sensor histidine kinase [Actinomadura alba]|uniref:histidine kinase n=1 Tax=Actinomadura alba TaxID=406431 RepID=A0ABR7LIC5_9ACTN|nr:ATP-binding protein [Actinomadura alba]MBC6464354.1 ATP-binding protein [Actinomadura alba]